MLLSTLILLAVPLASPVLDARAAQAIVQGCATHATGKGQSHAIVVVDTGGHQVAALRMDGNGFGIMEFAVAKAQAVAAWGFATASMAETVKTQPAFAAAPHVVPTAGGVPLYADGGGRMIGAIGVSGEAPADDAACATAGAVAAGLSTTR